MDVGSVVNSAGGVERATMEGLANKWWRKWGRSWCRSREIHTVIVQNLQPVIFRVRTVSKVSL